MTVEDARIKYTSLLKQHGVEEAADEAWVLLCYALNIDRAQLFAQPERVLSGPETAYIDGLFQRRIRGEPAAYIMRSREFYALELNVGPGVLIPRPETEILVEEAIDFGRRWMSQRKTALSIADVGTGSGAIAIALAVHLPGSKIYGIDISSRALETARLNIKKHGVEKSVALIHGNLLEKITNRVDMIVANLPYIARSELEQLPTEISGHEPKPALNGGAGGTELIEKLLTQCGDKVSKGGAILVEFGKGQEHKIVPVAESALPGSSVSLVKDLAGINRVLKIEL